MSFDLYLERDGAQRDDTQRDGAGASACLLHGWGMNLRVFDTLRTRLARSLALTLVDLPGHGRSPWPLDLTDCGEREVLIRTLLPTDTLMGWSLGGQLALEMALSTLGTAAAPQRLVLMATTPRFTAGEGWSAGLSLETLRQFGESLEQDPSGTIADFLGLQVRGSEHARETERALRAALERHGIAQLPALRAGLTRLLLTDLRDRLGSLTLPTLVIGGLNDRVTPPAALEALARLLPHARLTLLPRAAHAPFLSHPDEVADTIVRFIAGAS